MLSPVAAVLASLVALVAAAGALAAAGLSEDGLAAVATFGTGLLILLFGLGLVRLLPRAERRLVPETKHSIPGAVAMGVNVGVGLIIGAVGILALGTVVDPGLEDRLDDVSQEVGGEWWQMALLVASLVVLAPLGEELLFRGLLLRGLVRRLGFWWAAAVSGVVFAAAHADAYVIWPRAIALTGTGIVLAWLYRWRGYWAGVSAHATVNAVAAAALLAQS